MLVGVIGDIHGNIEALEAMVSFLKSHSVTRILCAGDVVGYGGAPGECVDFLRENKIACVSGNHDFYTLHPEMNHDGIREDAVEVFEWNRQVMTPEQLAWLSNLPMVLESKALHYQVRHASCQPYPAWEYVVNERRAAMHFLFQQMPLCFNGHSHIPILAMHRPGSKVMFARLRNMKLPRGMSILVGVGAVGQPRDGDPRACGVIYDTEENSIAVVRVPYDVAAAQKRIYDANLPSFLADRLAVGR